MRSIVKSGEKFGILIFPHIWTKIPKDFSYQLDESTWLSNNLKVPENDIWKGWLGSILWDDFVDAKLYLVTTLPSKSLNISDDQNRLLSDTCQRWWNLLKLTGSFKSKKPMIFNGYCDDDHLWIKATGTGDIWFHQGNNDFKPLEVKQVEHWKELHASYREMNKAFTTNKYFERIVFGLRNFNHAMSQQMINWRLPALVRSIEAFIKPSNNRKNIGKTFSKRAAYLSRVDKSISNISERTFSEIYKLRGQYDHLGKQAQPSDNEMNNIILCENFARDLYRRFFLVKEFQNKFLTNDSIDTFWQSSYL